jgi:hypothetical protein
MSKMGAPYGERHGNGKKYPDWLIKAVRMEYYDFGESVVEISRILKIPESTVRHWVLFYHRTHQNEVCA